MCAPKPKTPKAVAPAAPPAPPNRPPEEPVWDAEERRRSREDGAALARRLGRRALRIDRGALNAPRRTGAQI